MGDLGVLSAVAPSRGSDPLFVLPNGKPVDWASGYIPLLVNFTFEDKAAKGLRKRGNETTPDIPVHFSALERVRDCRALLLVGPTGSGKTTFAKHLCLRLAKGAHATASIPIRNEFGHTHEEAWEHPNIATHYFSIDSSQSLKTLSDSFLSLTQSPSGKQPRTGEEDLIIIDKIEKAGDGAIEQLSNILSHVEQSRRLRLLVLGEIEASKSWTIPVGITRHELLPLLQAQRREVLERILAPELVAEEIGLGAAAANPTIFALSVASGDAGEHAEKVLDAWLDSISMSDKEIAAKISSQALVAISSDQTAAAQIDAHQLDENAGSSLFSSRRTQELLAACHLAEVDIEEAIQLFYENPLKWKSVLQSLLVRARATGKVEALAEDLVRGLGDNAQRGALLVADIIDDIPKVREHIKQHMLAVVEHGTLAAAEREHAGRVLSKLGDPRDLTALAQVPAGNFILGSDSHPNSQPQAPTRLEAFSIGLYPVVNRDYAEFAQETGRTWVSPDRNSAEKLNAPATDLTWHDARAYCSWLTARWQANGKIDPHQIVRLPTEPEWERAARGQQDKPGAEGLVYPWGIKWQNNVSNSEEAGFNNTCAVGLFPEGRSPYGCFDMTGQVWEWCSTLWGEDMATPSFRHPWQQEDGREDLDAPDYIRRVLRGGCFSSSRLKACCTYRGSLEPGGFWRGNGFRIVVAAG